MLKTYNYNDSTQLTPHFNVREWKCKCGRQHEIIIDEQLPILLENLMTKIGAVRGDIYSGYRCSAHDKVVGGNGSSNRSHGGYAVDIYFTDKDGKRIPSRIVALTLEDMGHQYGIGYRCGKHDDVTGETHIDVKPRKWYGDESKSMTASCCSSFYDYFGIKKESSNELKYRTYDNVKNKWLPYVIAGTSDYAGNFGNGISGLQIENITYRVHDKIKNKWLPWVTGNSDYAGNLPNDIDGLQIQNSTYRVHIKGQGWLNWIDKVDDTNYGYAGIYGRTIDAIQISKVG